ncbi:MAG TPA: translation elongation factor Ts [Dongiaceae bacterium]|jgi:elongation factor Ts|nr:translation elongation factor Ts [Dongiaceae bacterium]
MAEITAALVKELREKTGAGMMDCKKALAETKGDLETAFDWLRKKGLAAAAKKAGRVAAEGLVGLTTEGTRGALVEVNSETDFVARNQDFQKFVSEVSKLALGARDVEALGASAYPNSGKTTAEMLTQLIATIGENMALRRMVSLSVGKGVVVGYMHNSQAPGLGKIGVLVALESTGDPVRLAGFGKQLAMHVAASSPQAVTVAGVDASAVERERSVLAEQARASGKAEEIIAKMVEGRLRKFYEEVVLLEQTYVIDGESKVKAAVAAVAKEIGAPVEIKAFQRMALGEGIEREQKDFAAEVAAQLGH